jgi:hypothetical protein
VSSYPSPRASQGLTSRGTDAEDVGSCSKHIPLSCPSSALMNFPLAMDRSPSQGPNASVSGSSFSDLSVAETLITEPDLTSKLDSPIRDIQSGSESTEDTPAFLFDPAYDFTCELKLLFPRLETDGSSRSTRNLLQTPFLDPPPPVWKAPPDRRSIVGTRVLTGIIYMLSRVVAALHFIQEW